MEKKSKQNTLMMDESAELAQTLIRCTGVGIYIVQDGKFQYVNLLFQGLTGYTEQELVGMHTLDLVHPEDRETVRKKAIENLKGHVILPYEYRLVKKNGEVMWVLERLASIEYGGKRATVGSFVDITKRKQAEVELGLRSKLLDSATDSIFVHDFEGNFVYVNETACRTHGYSREEFMKLKLQDIIVQDRPSGALESDFREMNGSEAIIEAVHRRKDGSLMPVEVHGRSIKADGRKLLLVVVRDITQHKRAEVELELKSQLLDSATDSIFVHDFEGNFVYVNETACMAHGYSREEFMKLKVPDIVLQRRVGQPGSDFQEMNGGEAIVESLHRHKDGSLIPVEVHGRSIKVDGSKLLLVVVRDITRRKQAQEALAKSEERYRTVLDQMEDAYYEVDLAGNITFCNDATCRQLGYTREEFMGMNYREYTSEEDRQRVYRAFNHVYNTGKPVKAFPAVRIRKEGSQISTETSAFPLLNGSGEVIGFRGVSRDVTDRAMMIKALSESEERYRNILTEMQEGYYEVDIAGNLTFVNEATCRQLGYTREELLGMNYRAYVHKDEQKDVYKAWNKVYRTGKPLQSYPFTFIRKDGTRTYSESSVSALRNNEGKIIGFRSISRDVTKRK